MKRKDRWIAGLLAGTCATGAGAQQAVPAARTGGDAAPVSAQPEPPAAAQGDGDIVVAGRRPRGSVIGDIPPERTFRPIDLQAFGVDSIEALLGVLASQTASNRGRGDEGPVTLLNGRRVSSFAEIARIPVEAIERTEIFPEEVALKYGYRADQKVVNVVTHERYQSRIGQAGVVAPTDGGRLTGNADADYLLIRDNTRFSLGATYARSTALLESERDVRQPSDMPDLGRFRTLLPSTEQFLVNGVVSGQVADEVSGTLNARFETNRSESRLGRADDRTLRRDGDRQMAHLGATLGGRAGTWQWTAIGNYDRTHNRTLTDLGDRAAGRDDARSTEAVASADLILSGPVATLPAGPLYASARGGFEFRDLESRSSRGAAAARTDLGRDRGGLQVNLDLPLFGPVNGRPSGIGRLSANGNVAVDRLSDAGDLWTVGGGLNWSPVKAIGIIVSGTRGEGAPTLEQLGGPTLTTPNVRVYDIARQEAADITQLSGGNPGLRNDQRHLLRLGINVRPLPRRNLTFSLDYVATRIENPIAVFPVVTPQVEAAFPDRFVRDTDGRLLRIDARPINFATSRQQQLRYGINLTKPLGQVPSGMEDGFIQLPPGTPGEYIPLPGQTGSGPSQTFMFKPAPGSEFARNLDTAASRLFVSLYHNWFLQDSLVLRDGLPALDLLDGGAVDLGGGRRRHEIEFQAGASKKGLGIRLSATWQSGTEIRGTGTDDRLRFDSLARVNLNLFANLDDRFGKSQALAWLKGTRATLEIANVFNARPDVRDRLGATPIAYQRAYLDPLGRAINVRLRKLF